MSYLNRGELEIYKIQQRTPMTKWNDLPRESICVDVAFYDENHRSLLLKLPNSQQILSTVANGIQIPTAQFLTYYLFHKKRLGKDGYRGYHDLEAHISKAIGEIEDWIEFAENTVSAAADARPFDRTLTERYGEAIGLSVVNALHGLHEADWDKIPERPGRHGLKTFDYAASDGVRMIQVETKGCVIETPRPTDQNVRNHKNSIELKKSSIAKTEDYPYSADVRYGTIAALTYEGRPRCWLLDPPSDIALNPRRWRLIARMNFIADLIVFLLPRSQLASSLVTRVADVAALRDPFELDGLTLIRPDGKAIGRVVEMDWMDAPHDRLSYVDGSPTVGHILILKQDRLFFIGIRDDLIDLAISQDFHAILEQSAPPHSTTKWVLCRIPRGRATRRGVESLDQKRRKDRIEFWAKGQLFYSAGGLVFGVVEPTTPPAELF